MSPPEPFRIAFAPGVTPGKWTRIWAERVPRRRLEVALEEDPVAVLRQGGADMCFVRLPVDREGLELIPLYREVPVVVVPVDHPVAAYDEVSLTDLADENLLADESMPTGQAIEVVAGGAGIVIVPMSVARLHHRKDVTARPVTGVDESQIGLAWQAGNEDPGVGTFIGIVRGRTARSSRAEPAEHGQGKTKTPAPKVAKPGPKRPVGKRPPRPGRAGGNRRRGR